MAEYHFGGARVRSISAPDLSMDADAARSCRDAWARRREDPEHDARLRRRSMIAGDNARRKRLGQNKVTLPTLACLEKPVEE
jgi:hypothetical protein